MTCENSVGSYSCSCGQGLELDRDQRSCKGRFLIFHNFITCFSDCVNQSFYFTADGPYIAHYFMSMGFTWNALSAVVTK